MKAHQKILEAFLTCGYLTSSDLVAIAGYRYSARLGELRKKGFTFAWDYKKNLAGKKTHTTLYVMTTPRCNIDVENVAVV